jgi:hypothetical protein
MDGSLGFFADELHAEVGHYRRRPFAARRALGKAYGIAG